jgi:hypothetical protein
MATNAYYGYPTLTDIVSEYSGMDAETYLTIAEIMNRACPFIRMLPMVKSNQIMSNIGARDAVLVSPSTRRFNEPIAPTSTKSAPFTEPIALFQDFGEVDWDLYRIQGDMAPRWRMNQDRRKIEGMTQKMEWNLYYGSLYDDPGSFNGLLARFNSLTYSANGDTTWVNSGYNVLSNGGGTSANTTSVWMLELGENKVFGIYPKNLPGGLEFEDYGPRTKDVYVSAGVIKKMRILESRMTWFMGIQIDDERCVQRISSCGTTIGGTGQFDETLLIQAKNQLPGSGEAPGTVILCNRAVKTQMDIRAISLKTNTYFTQNQDTGDVWGRGVTRFQGIPVLTAEKILNTETGLS